jgi:hypothetical protein
MTATLTTPTTTQDTQTPEYFTRVEGNLIPKRGRPRSGFYARIYGQLCSKPINEWYRYNTQFPDIRSYNNFYQSIRARATEDGRKMHTVTEKDVSGNITVYLKLTNP